MFKVNNEEIRTTSTDVVLMPCFVDFARYFCPQHYSTALVHSVSSGLYREADIKKLDSRDLMGESDIDFRTYCVIMTLAGRGLSLMTF